MTPEPKGDEGPGEVLEKQTKQGRALVRKSGGRLSVVRIAYAGGERYGVVSATPPCPVPTPTDRPCRLSSIHVTRGAHTRTLSPFAHCSLDVRESRKNWEISTGNSVGAAEDDGTAGTNAQTNTYRLHVTSK